jgi:trans-aconitate methyltransferase
MNPEWPEKIEKLLIDGSVLDLGCGSGRFYPVFQSRDYTGIDKDPNFAETLSKQYPKGRWITEDFTTWKPKRNYDNVFSWVVSQHIPPEQFEKLAVTLKKINKQHHLL